MCFYQLSTQQFDWNEYEQNYVIGSFYWGYILTELLGGRLSEVIGARKVFGYSMLFSSFITLLTPLSAKIHLAAIVVLRFLLGFLLVSSKASSQHLLSIGFRNFNGLCNENGGNNLKRNFN